MKRFTFPFVFVALFSALFFVLTSNSAPVAAQCKCSLGGPCECTAGLCFCDDFLVPNVAAEDGCGCSLASAIETAALTSGFKKVRGYTAEIAKGKGGATFESEATRFKEYAAAKDANCRAVVWSTEQGLEMLHKIGRPIVVSYEGGEDTPYKARVSHCVVLLREWSDGKNGERYYLMFDTNWRNSRHRYQVVSRAEVLRFAGNNGLALSLH